MSCQVGDEETMRGDSSVCTETSGHSGLSVCPVGGQEGSPLPLRSERRPGGGCPDEGGETGLGWALPQARWSVRIFSTGVHLGASPMWWPH